MDGNFAEYHMSPNAIIADRTSVAMPKGLPLGLLLAITKARAIQGDWKNAILGFDTALRLCPTSTPLLFFTTLIHERSLCEAYTIAHIACRSQTVPPAALVGYLVGKITALQKNFEYTGGITKADLDGNVRLSEAILELLTAYRAAGGALKAEHIVAFITSLSNMAINLQYARDSDESEARNYAAFNTKLFGLAQRTLGMPRERGQWRSLVTLTSLVAIAGKTKDKNLTGQLVSEMITLRQEPDAAAFRCLINAAGKCGDLDTMKTVWQSLVENATTNEGKGLTQTDWVALALAARDSRQVAAPAFIESEMAKHSLSDDTRDTVRDLYAKQKFKEALDTTLKDLPLDRCIDRLTEALDKFEQQLKAEQGNNPLSQPQMPVELFPNYPQLKAERQDLRQIYEELATDPMSAAIDTKGNHSAELRFENWCSVNTVLATAEAYEKYKVKCVDEAISDGKAAADVRMQDPRRWLASESGNGAVEVASDGSENPQESQDNLAWLRARIRGLRGLSDG